MSITRSFSFRDRAWIIDSTSPTIQLRATIEKEVSQLSFSDFSLSQDNSDDDQNVQGGNPDVVQEQTWRYDVNFEYRLPEGLGVINTQLYYRDIDDVIGRIDVSASEENLLSARGNIGAGKRYGISVEASSKLTPLGLPNALATLRIGAGDSSVVDPFLLRKRRMRYPGRWSTRASFRHDISPGTLATASITAGPISRGCSGSILIYSIQSVIRKSTAYLSFWKKGPSMA